MVKIIKEIPNTKAARVILPKSRPEVDAQKALMRFPEENISVPHQLQPSVYKLCGIDRTEWYTASSSNLEEKIKAANQEKDIILRFTDDKTPISAVSDKFKEMNLKEVQTRVEKITRQTPVIRYFPDEERLQFIFPISSQLRGLHLFLDSGDYGTYGGSGSNAIRYGFAWPNKVASKMTSAILLEQGRIIHLEGPEVENRINRVLKTTRAVTRAVEKSKKNMLTADETAEYLAHHKKHLTDGMTKPLYQKTLNVPAISAYDISLAITHRLTAQVSDAKRISAEYLAGKLILAYDRVKEEAVKWVEETRQTPKPQKLNY